MVSANIQEFKQHHAQRPLTDWKLVLQIFLRLYLPEHNSQILISQELICSMEAMMTQGIQLLRIRLIQSCPAVHTSGKDGRRRCPMLMWWMLKGILHTTSQDKEVLEIATSLLQLLVSLSFQLSSKKLCWHKPKTMLAYMGSKYTWEESHGLSALTIISCFSFLITQSWCMLKQMLEAQ